jgi:hypothetical protein
MKGTIFQDVKLSSVLKFVDVSEIHIASIFRVEEQSKLAENRASRGGERKNIGRAASDLSLPNPVTVFLISVQ